MENKIILNKKWSGFKSFVKKYGYFICAGIIVVGVTLAVVLTTTKSTGGIVPEVPIDVNKDIPDPVEDVTSDAITFSLPLLNCSIAQDYSVDALTWNSTLGWYQTHSGIDLISENSSDVLAACTGKVTQVYTDTIEGTVIVVKHSDKYSTKYASLGSDVSVKVGDSVIAGQKIGTTSISATNELSTGAHLHFELWEDGLDVNPNDYLSIESK